MSPGRPRQYQDHVELDQADEAAAAAAQALLHQADSTLALDPHLEAGADDTMEAGT